MPKPARSSLQRRKGDEAYQIIVACEVTAAANDKQQAVPMAQLTLAHLEQAGMERPKDAAGEVQKIAGTYDSGYYSEAAAEAVEQIGFDPYMATGRQRHPVPETEEVEAPTTEGADGRESADRRRTGVVRPTQSDRRTGVWSDQRSAGFPTVFAARLGQHSG